MTRAEALKELARWAIEVRTVDRGWNRSAVFRPLGFDVDVAEIRATTTGGHIAVERLIAAITKLIVEGLPKPRKVKR